MMKFKELDAVVTLADRLEEGILAGSSGTIVVAFAHPREAYEVEFSDYMGIVFATAVYLPHELRLSAN